MGVLSNYVRFVRLDPTQVLRTKYYGLKTKSIHSLQILIKLLCYHEAKPLILIQIQLFLVLHIMNLHLYIENSQKSKLFVCIYHLKAC